MCCARCWLITPSIGWIGDSLYPTPPSSSSRDGGELSRLAYYIVTYRQVFFFFTFFVDKFILFARMHATMNANFSACMVCAEQDSTPQRTEMDYGNKESYDKRDGERD